MVCTVRPTKVQEIQETRAYFDITKMQRKFIGLFQMFAENILMLEK